MIDIVSLYGTLQHKLLLLVLDGVMECCRSDWSLEFRTLIKDLVKLSFLRMKIHSVTSQKFVNYQVMVNRI